MTEPKFCTIDNWLALSGMGRRATYEALGRGDLTAIKCGTRTLIDAERGLQWLRSLPPAVIRPSKTARAAEQQQTAAQ